MNATYLVSELLIYHEKFQFALCPMDDIRSQRIQVRGYRAMSDLSVSAGRFEDLPKEQGDLGQQYPVLD